MTARDRKTREIVTFREWDEPPVRPDNARYGYLGRQVVARLDPNAVATRNGRPGDVIVTRGQMEEAYAAELFPRLFEVVH